MSHARSPVLTALSPAQRPERRRRVERRAPPPHPLATALAAALDGAAGTAPIELLFQPQYACDTGAIIGAEALARWNPAGRATMAGDALFAVAAQSGLGERLARHLFGRAIGAARGWPGSVHLSLNVQPADLAAPGFVAMIKDLLAAESLTPGRLTLEITEQALVDELDRSAERLQHLADMGVRLALDDFGAGFCNFRYLKLLPLHGLKLDRSMVEGVAESARDLAVLRGIVAMARAIGLEVLAEGIETEAQRAVVAAEACHAWQGYLGARPVTAAEFARLVG